MKDAGLETNLTIIDPVGYFDMLELLKHCKLVMSDSGGLQKEAFFFQKFCITLRDETEWVELVNGGFNFLAGADENKRKEMKADMEEMAKEFAPELWAAHTSWLDEGMLGLYEQGLVEVEYDEDLNANMRISDEARQVMYQLGYVDMENLDDPDN
jgi:hypothetical protein